MSGLEGGGGPGVDVALSDVIAEGVVGVVGRVPGTPGGDGATLAGFEDFVVRGSGFAGCEGGEEDGGQKEEGGGKGEHNVVLFGVFGASSRWFKSCLMGVGL